MGRRELLTAAIVLGAMIVSFAAAVSGKHFSAGAVSAEAVSVPADPSAASAGSTSLPPDALPETAPTWSPVFPPNPPTHPKGCPSSSGYGYGY